MEKQNKQIRTCKTCHYEDLSLNECPCNKCYSRKRNKWIEKTSICNIYNILG